MSGAFDRRGAALSAAPVVALALLLGLVPASGTTARDRETGVQAIYDCAAGAVRVPVTVSFAGAYPREGRPGAPSATERFSVRPELTPQARAALLPPGATEVSGTARLSVEAAQNGRSARADWADLDAPAGTEPSFAGPVPPVTLREPGEVTLTAGELTLLLRAAPGSPAPTAPAPGSPTAPGPTPPAASGPAPGASAASTAPAPEASGTPPSPSPAGPVEVRCAPARNPGPLLARWTVLGAEPGAPVPKDGAAPPPPIQVAPRPLAAAPVCPADRPTGELDRSRLPKPPPGAVEGSLGASLCVVAVGYATVRKLGSAMVVNDPRGTPGLLHLDLGRRTVSATDYDESDSVGVLGFPDAESTFLVFGFQPTSARITFEPQAVTVVNVRRGQTFTTTVAYRQYLRVHDVRVGGTPLDVGPRCRTARPVDTVLGGAYDFLTGGVLDGRITIPPFTGCTSHGEDLSRLFTAALSGPDNAVRIRQGRLAGAGSAPPVPELPQR
ncbi:DUF6801 domain-containing protein [Streptomyces sp. cg36]|uniref:DUF6801 domain-containing protein n=1 Tax=Streptomyces sp. cg36 TaxID=3238798 RepID=UPI0034E27122